jgi:hypothetical protein
MNILSVVFQYNYLWLIAGLVLALLLSLLVYAKPSAYFSAAQRWLLGSLRFLGLSMLVILLMRPMLKKSISEVEMPVVVVAFDHSSSMLIHEEEEKLQQSWTEWRARMTEKFSDTFLLDWIAFDRGVQPADSHHFTGKQTNLSAPMDYATKRYSQERLKSIVLLTDGWHNSGIDPWQFADRISAPIMAVLYGDTVRKMDAAIERVVHNPVVFAGNVLEVETEISFEALNGKSASVYLEVDGRRMDSKQLSVRSDRDVQRIKMQVSTEGLNGLVKMRVVVDKVGEEQYLKNNALDFVVEVIDSRRRIWLMAAKPHPDLGAIRNALEAGGQNEVEIHLGKSLPSGELPNVVVIHDMAIDQQLQAALQNTPTWHILGAESTLSQISLGQRRSKSERAQPDFNTNFGRFSIPDWWMTNAAKLPPLESYYPRLSAGKSAILAKTIVEGVRTERPLFFTWENKGVPMAALNGTGLWTWRMHAYRESGSHEVFNDFMQQIFRYLGSVQQNQRLYVNYPKRVKETQTMRMEAKLFDATFSTSIAGELKIKLFRDKEKLYELDFLPGTDDYSLSINDLQPGTYSFELNASLADERFSSKGGFVVEEFQLEQQKNEANLLGMKELTGSSPDGLLVFPNDISTLETALANLDSPKILRERLKMRPLIDFLWLMLLVVLIFATEWFIRRRMGSY